MRLAVDITKRLGSFCLHVAFACEDGVLGILGASGCGKSMTLKCIAGIERPDSGHIELDGVTLFASEKRINLPPQKRHVGYLFQNYALFPNMTVRQNILCGLRAEKRSRAQSEQALREVMELLGLTGLERRLPSQLSGGQQQRTALARILISQPKLLMLDEPFSALDTHLREKLQIEMKHLLRSYQGATLMVTHSRDEAYRLCDRIALMKTGRILTLQPTKRLFANPGTIAAAAVTGCKNIAKAVKAGEYEVDVPEWGVRLRTAAPVREGLCAVGIRAHYFNPRCMQNRCQVELGEIMEEPFELTVPFRYENQKSDSSELWWRLSKDCKPAAAKLELGVAPENVLLLYDEAEDRQ